VRRAPAAAKINLALVVGPRREDGRHEVTTVLQRVDLCDRIRVEAAPELSVTGFADDTIVRSALEALAEAAGTWPAFAATITKRIPVAGGLGGGSSDAATALRLANELLPEPLEPARLVEIARGLGADVPFFLAPGPQLGEGDGRDLRPVRLPQDYRVLLLLLHGEAKESTAAVYRRFDEREGAAGYDERRAALLEALDRVESAADLASLPPNDLAASPLTRELRDLGAFRADVSGAGPTVYGLFARRRDAEAAKRALKPRGRVWTTVPAWYF
jgi:4-diphosphocytidyl-2-C-methyl-D-erythritol kinase